MASRLYLLTSIFLLTALQSPAQHHVRRHDPLARHASRLPDSVTTSEDEIGDAPAVTENTDTSATDTSATDTSATETTAPPVLRSIPDTSIRAWKNSHDFDYANDASLWKRKKEERENSALTRFFDSKAWQYFIYILLGSVLLYALYRIIAENNLRFFYRKPVRIKDTPLEEAELPEEDLDQLLKRATEGKEYRIATRYLYLKALRHLDAREMIRWHSQSTDAEYVRQMDVRPQGERFRWLTSAYERVWYGKFFLDEGQFSRLSQYFQDFHNAVDHPPHA